MEDILFIDKPKGITSFDVIRQLRKELKEGVQSGYPIPKLGHAGTLDPLASGLMLVGVGEGTKKLNEYIKLPKEYIADILVGERRETGDMEGKVLEEVRVPSIEVSLIHEVLSGMIGTLQLPVPAYSAVKQGGERLYKKAREGKDIELPVRDMEVYEAEFLGLECGGERCVVEVRFYVASGVYIRSLAEEFGRRLGYPATIKDLRRTKIGEFDIKDARKI